MFVFRTNTAATLLWRMDTLGFCFCFIIAGGSVISSGQVQQGARRWFNLKVLNFQPSEIMKLAMPMMLAWVLSKKNLPPKVLSLLICAVLLAIPVLLTAKQPDLGSPLS